ncbi:MAG TPA: 3-dehydroquinate synthase [Phycisphaerales bacterium]|nr:3-dehydroquinate synthase [Phycisphaerales bacterium]
MLCHEVKIPPTPGGGYRITIGTGLLPTVWERVCADFAAYTPFVLTDEDVVAAGHLARLVGSNDAASYVIRPSGEKSKTVDTAVAIVETMEKAFLGRDSIVLALGGGTVGDIAGFAAAVFKRGVPVVQIPTTTLAQADSAVGGKTGVDSSVSKNAFGAFWHPAAVYIDVATLETLDERQYRAGIVESIKHGLIADSSYFEFIEANIDAILARDTGVLEQIALANCRIKGAVVEADPMERNQRRMLNYGHTIGHAVEAASGYGLLHGEAVAVGIVAAGLIEAEMGLANDDRLVRIRALFERLGVPRAKPGGIRPSELMDLLRHDKKAVHRWPKFVLIEGIGQVYVRNGAYAVDVPPEIVSSVLERL